MLNVKPLSQRDPRWKDKKLGFSTYSIGSKGCTITCLTMLVNYVYNFDLRVDQFNEAMKKVDGFAKDSYGQKSLIIWSKVPIAYPKLKWIYRDYNYSNTKVSWYVYVHKIPVCVEVNAWSIGAPKHWVLFCGDRKMADPWTGVIESTAKYPLTGDALYQRS
jgi:hypothetical protein